MKIILTAIFLMIVFGMASSPVFSHKTVEVDPYEIEVGWNIEPPVVGIRNDFVFEISEPGEKEGVKTGVKNAFKNLEVTARFGGVTKTLDIASDPKPGHYLSPVIPTRTGSITIDIKGDINGVLVDVSVPIEDVESTAVLDFPPTGGSSSDQDVAALKNAVSSLQKDFSEFKTKFSGVDADSDLNVSPAYDFALLGLSLGSAGVILAVIAMIKRR